MLHKLFFPLLLVLFMGCGTFEPIGPLVQLGLQWKAGEARKYYQVPQDKLAEATRSSITSLGLVISKERIEDKSIRIWAGNNDRFKIAVTRTSSEVTCLSIRVNFMGDKDYAELVYRTVDQKLKR